jgi:hypothetical protein
MANNVKELLAHLRRRAQLGYKSDMTFSLVNGNPNVITMTKVFASALKRSASSGNVNVFNSFEKRLLRQSRVESARLIVDAARKLLARLAAA